MLAEKNDLIKVIKNRNYLADHEPNVQDSILLISQPLGRVFLAELLDDSDGGLGHVSRKVELFNASQNDVVDLHRITCRERRAGN